MSGKVYVLSRRNIDQSPAMCCMVELENILLREHDAELCHVTDPPPKVEAGATVFCVLLAFYQFNVVEEHFAALKQAGCRIVVYLFDCWDAQEVLYSRRRMLRDRLRPALRLEALVDRICVPLRAVADGLRPQHRALVRHVPLATDTSLANGHNPDRPISILAYGRQPPEITRALAESMNGPHSPLIFHHTDHLTVGQINDRHLHRMHFWKLAQSSQIALAYDPRLTSPQRVTMSIVGQRWYESLAAGCVIAGSRPVTDEANELLDWPDSTIELPDAPGEAVDMLRELTADAARIAAIRERNVEHVRARHDWRHRIPAMLG